MALVTVEDLRNYMDIGFTNKQQQGAQLVLDGLHNELEFLLRRPIEVGEYTERWIVPASQNPYATPSPFAHDSALQSTTYQSKDFSQLSIPYDLHLDQSPVITVYEVERDRPQGASITLVEGTDFITEIWGLYVYNVFEGDALTVRYSAGLEGENLPYLKLILLRAAARETQNLHDDVVGLKDLTTRNVAPLDVGFTDMEEKRLQRYRRYRI